MVSSVLILLFVALVLASGQELCPSAGKRCLPICDLSTLNHTAIPKIFFANGTVDAERNQLRPEDRFHVFEWDPCPESSALYYLNPVADGDPHTYRLLRDGTLYRPYTAEGERFQNVGEYCMNYSDEVVGYTPHLCITGEIPPEEDETARLVCSLLSVPFLIATVWVYSVVPELKNTHGNTLRCYLCCLIVCLVAHGTREMVDSIYHYRGACLLVGYTAYFSFLASFLWLNVMCFNMWWMFGGFGAVRNNAAQRSRKNFIYYSIYAWGVPALLIGSCLCLELIPGLTNSQYNPQFQSGICWFNLNKPRATYLFSYGPVALTIIGNIFFFVSTSIKISQHNCTGKQNKTTNNSSSASFSLHLKLFVVMGIIWILEVMGWWLEEPKPFWKCVEIVISFQGIAIFVILVCKKNIWISLKGHYEKSCSRLFRCCVANEEKSHSADSRESHTVVNKRDTVFTDDTSSSQIV